MKLYLVRHGEAEGSAGRAVGQLDLPLSPRGIESIEALAATWPGASPVRLWASDLRRAQQSAALLAPRLGVEPHLDARLREVSFGDWEGRTWDDIYETDRGRYDAWTERWWELAPPGGESFTDLGARIFAWYRDLAAGLPAGLLKNGVSQAGRDAGGPRGATPQGEGDSTPVVVVAHGGSIRALLVKLLAIPKEHAFEITLGPARVSAVEIEEGGCELLFLDQAGFVGLAR